MASAESYHASSIQFNNFSNPFSLLRYACCTLFLFQYMYSDKQTNKNDHKFCQELPPKYFLLSLSKDYCTAIVLVMLNNSYISLCDPDTRRAGPRYSPWRRLGRCGAAVGRAGLPARCHGNRARPAPAPRSYWLRCVDVTLGARFSSLPLRCAAACGRFPGQPPGRPGAILVRPEGGAPQEGGGRVFLVVLFYCFVFFNAIWK